jgi:uncharacterized protein YndB with AHSA1/START domain
MSSPDIAETTDLVIVRRTVNATVQRAYRVWTDPEAVKFWSAPGPWTTTHTEADVRVGGHYRTHMRGPNGEERHLIGTYLEVDPPHRLKYTHHWDKPKNSWSSEVTVEFRDLGSTTEVILTHALLPDDSARTGHAQGWNGCMEKFVALVNAGA